MAADLTAAAADRAAIERLERDWRDAILAQDISRLETLLHADFQLVGIRSTGRSAFPRPTWLAVLRTMRFDHLDASVSDVWSDGHTAIATVEGSWRLRMGETPIDERFLLTDVWVRDGTTWRVVRRHSSPYAAG